MRMTRRRLEFARLRRAGITLAALGALGALGALAAVVTPGALAAVPAMAAPGAVTDSVSAPPEPPLVTGYAEDGTAAKIVAREAHALTTVGVDGVTVSRNGGSVHAPDRGVDSLLRAAHANGLRAELLVSNFDDRIGDFSPAIGARLLRSPAHIGAVAGQLAGIVAQGGWAGVTVDLESLARKDGSGLTAFVQALQADMPSAKTVSIDLMASTRPAGYADHAYQLAPLAAAADVLALMAYDRHGPTWSGPGPVGPLPWVRTTLRALLSVVPADQVDLGVAGYGYTWPAPPHRHDGRTLTDAGARRLVANAGATPHWRPGAGEWTATLSDGTIVWWSDARSWLARVAVANDLHLHGLALWRIGSADPLP